METVLTEADVKARLVALVDRVGGVVAAAAGLGVSDSYLSLVIAGKRRIGPRLARGLQLRAVRHFVPDSAARRAARA